MTELNASTGAVVQTIDVGPQPSGISSDGTHVWVADFNDGIPGTDGLVSEIATGSPPSSAVLLPANSATVSGTQYLDASASSGVTKVTYELSGGPSDLSDVPVATATPTIYGWLATWDTTTVPNGVYTLQSVASAGAQVLGAGAGITVTVEQPAPATAVVLPANDATISGTTQYFDASASSGVTNVTYELSGGPSDLSDVPVATATPTIYGWLATWDTTTVPNGVYTLQSVASAYGVSASSSPVTVTVNNPPPSTTVLIPSSGATLTPASQTVFDAAASPGVTKVSFQFGGVCQSSSVITATPTIYGWIAVVPAGSSVGNPIPISCSIQSVASYSGGVSGTSPPVDVTVIVYVIPPS